MSNTVQFNSRDFSNCANIPLKDPAAFERGVERYLQVKGQEIASAPGFGAKEGTPNFLDVYLKTTSEILGWGPRHCVSVKHELDKVLAQRIEQDLTTPEKLSTFFEKHGGGYGAFRAAERLLEKSLTPWKDLDVMITGIEAFEKRTKRFFPDGLSKAANQRATYLATRQEINGVVEDEFDLPR